MIFKILVQEAQQYPCCHCAANHSGHVGTHGVHQEVVGFVFNIKSSMINFLPQKNFYQMKRRDFLVGYNE